MYCWKCGKPLPEEARFCPHCGAEVRIPKEEIKFTEDGKGGLILETPEDSTVTISDTIIVRDDGNGGLIFDVPEGTTVTIGDPEERK